MNDLNFRILWSQAHWHRAWTGRWQILSTDISRLHSTTKPEVLFTLRWNLELASVQA